MLLAFSETVLLDRQVRGVESKRTRDILSIAAIDRQLSDNDFPLRNA